MRNAFLILTFGAILFLVAFGFLKNRDVEKPLLLQLKQKYSKKSEQKKVDHSKFESLNKDFKDPHEVTKECETCHNLTASELMKSNHYSTRGLLKKFFAFIKNTSILQKSFLKNIFCVKLNSFRR